MLIKMIGFILLVLIVFCIFEKDVNIIKKISFKTIIKLILFIPIVTIIVLISIAFFIGIFHKDKMILDGYYKKEEYFDKQGFQDYTDYCKYFYKKNDMFISNKSYKKVRQEDIEKIKGYFQNLEKWMDIEYRSNEYDFDEEVISEGDYFYIDASDNYDNYNIYFFDSEKLILYYGHNNT